MDAVDDLLADLDSTSDRSPTIVKESPKKPTTEELKERLREKKRNGARQKQIQQKAKKLANQSHPLEPIYFCENKTCTTIMNISEVKRCAVCKVFNYCSTSCQKEDWTRGHKHLCSKKGSDDEDTAAMIKKRLLYINAHGICDKLISKFGPGKYLTVTQTKDDHPACMFAGMADKSNVLNWKEFMKTAVFTTTGYDTLGDFSPKVKAAQKCYPDNKIFLLSVVLDRVREGQNTECAVRLFIAPDYGETMDAPIGKNGKITRTVTKYQRR